MFDDTYKTIDKPSESVYKEKGSKFIAKAFPVHNENEAKERIATIKKEYHDATHHCYAYVLHFDKSAFRVNDDGEPSGTAGKPIYRQILSFDLTHVLVVVIRYFGGTKLGVSGLLKAYKTASFEALQKADKITKIVSDVYEIVFDYSSMNNVMNALKTMNATQLSHQFESQCVLIFSIRKTHSNKAYEHLRKINNCTIRYIKTI